MNQKVIVTSSELGQIWHAIIVRNAGFEVAEMSEEYIGDCYDKMVDIQCEDGTVFHCKTEMDRAFDNEISWMPFDEVETWLSSSIADHEQISHSDRVSTPKEIHAYENLVRNAERIRGMINEQQLKEQPQLDTEIKMEV